ncbi:MAG: sulfatase [Promethearchaeia archaeon]
MLDLIIFLLILIGLMILVLLILRAWIRKKRDIRPKRLDKFLESLSDVKANQDKPNIIIILTDDMGYADISCFNLDPQSIQTPNIDKLANKGVTFTNFYSSAPICSPSRAGLLTGRYPVRTHVPTVFIPSDSLISPLARIFLYSYGMKGISPDEITLPEVLKKVGYHTALVGKWHLGDSEPHLPNDKGFDFFYGAHFSNDMDPYEIYRDKTVELEEPVDQDELTKLLTKECLNFIKKSKDNPFFLYYAQPFPHEPLHASDDFKGSSHGGVYGDAVQEVDWSVGKIIDTLKKENLLENTLILFSSDNGPFHQGNPGYTRGRKGLTLEGGQKVPFFAYWPKHIPAGIKNDTPLMNIDLFPTLLNIIGIPLPDDRIIDGTDFSPLLKEESAELEERPLYYFWNKELQAVRNEKWKYNIKHRSDISTYFYLKLGPSLFDLDADPNESYNLISHFPEKGQRLKDQLEKMKDHLSDNLRGWKD